MAGRLQMTNWMLGIPVQPNRRFLFIYFGFSLCRLQSSNEAKVVLAHPLPSDREHEENLLGSFQ